MHAVRTPLGYSVDPPLSDPVEGFLATGVPREEMRPKERKAEGALGTLAVPVRRLSVSLSRPLISLRGPVRGALRWKGVYKGGLNCFTTIVCTDLFDKTLAQSRGGG